MMRVAKIWSRVADGVPVLDDQLGRLSDDSPEKLKIMEFLDGGSEVLRSAGFAEDWLDPQRPIAVPIGFRTDGEWLWSEEVGYYLREHDVLPDQEFLDHMQMRSFVPCEATAAAIYEAEQLLRSEG